MPLRVCSPLTLSDPTIRLRTILAEKQKEEEANERSREQFRDLGRRRLEHLKRDTLVWISERSGRAVTPDCPRISRASDEMVEAYDPYAFWAKEADFLLSLMGEALAD
jgi:hypothetical protein